jgi:hypothetical protein
LEDGAPSTKRRKVDEAVAEAPGDAVAPKATLAGPKVAIIVPFRDLHVEQKRSEHLRAFVPAMTRYFCI